MNFLRILPTFSCSPHSNISLKYLRLSHDQWLPVLVLKMYNLQLLHFRIIFLRNMLELINVTPEYGTRLWQLLCTLTEISYKQSGMELLRLSQTFVWSWVLFSYFEYTAHNTHNDMVWVNVSGLPNSFVFCFEAILSHLCAELPGKNHSDEGTDLNQKKMCAIERDGTEWTGVQREWWWLLLSLCDCVIRGWIGGIAGEVVFNSYLFSWGAPVNRMPWFSTLFLCDS